MTKHEMSRIKALWPDAGPSLIRRLHPHLIEVVDARSGRTVAPGESVTYGDEFGWTLLAAPKRPLLMWFVHLLDLGVDVWVRQYSRGEDATCWSVQRVRSPIRKIKGSWVVLFPS